MCRPGTKEKRNRPETDVRIREEQNGRNRITNTQSAKPGSPAGLRAHGPPGASCARGEHDRNSTSHTPPLVTNKAARTRNRTVMRAVSFSGEKGRPTMACSLNWLWGQCVGRDVYVWPNTLNVPTSVGLCVLGSLSVIVSGFMWVCMVAVCLLARFGSVWVDTKHLQAEYSHQPPNPWFAACWGH